ILLPDSTHDQNEFPSSRLCPPTSDNSEVASPLFSQPPPFRVPWQIAGWPCPSGPSLRWSDTRALATCPLRAIPLESSIFRLCFALRYYFCSGSSALISLG